MTPLNPADLVKYSRHVTFIVEKVLLTHIAVLSSNVLVNNDSEPACTIPRETANISLNMRRDDSS